VQETQLFWPSDFAIGRANPSKAEMKLGDVVSMMVDAQLWADYSGRTVAP